MSNLLVNTRDQRFVLFEQLDVEKLLTSDPFGDFSKEDLLMILGEAEKMAVHVIAPTLAEGDREGCTFINGKVSAPKCFHHAFRKYIEGGWANTMESPDVGGQGLPCTIGFAAMELFGAANYAFCMYPGLTHGAAGLIHSFGTEEQKKKYMQKLFAGEWCGTMCLTEPNAGTDVGALKTSARRLPDGKYLITGTKCFISSGDHDLTPNIIHPVLARIEGDPKGTKGISIFIVPKYRVNDDGSQGEFNDVKTGGIEHKMGIHGNATCTLNFGEDGQCIGELLGHEREGIKVMFQMMNGARLGTGMQGLDLASAAYEHALAYAKERVQSAPVWKMSDPDAASVTIIHHPDVRRRLLWMKSHIEGIRAMCYFAASCMDLCRTSKTEEEFADGFGFLELITPIIKAYSTDKGFLICSMAMDIYGGYGYCAEYPVEQYLRDEKIATIYEGTNGIQALDLVGRKLAQRKGRNLMNLTAMIQKNIAAAKTMEELAGPASVLEEAVNACLDLTVFFAKTGVSGKFFVPLLNAGKFLEIMGDIMIGHFLIEAAAISAGKLADLYRVKSADSESKQKILHREDADAAFYSGKIASAKFFTFEVLTTVKARCESVKLGDTTAMDMSEEAFS